MKKRVHVSAANDKVSVAHLSASREILEKKKKNEKKRKNKHLGDLAALQTEVIRFLTHQKAPKMPLKPR